MTRLKFYMLPIAVFAAPLAANAAAWQDEHGGRRYDDAPVQVFWEGNCKIERKFDRDGALLERRTCRGERYTDARAPRPYADDPAPRRYTDDEEPPRSSGDDEAPRHQEAPASQPRRAPDYRDQRRYAPAPVERYHEPAAFEPRSATPAAAIAKPPVVTAKPIVAAPAPAVPAKAVAEMKAPRIEPKAAAAAPAPRLVAKAVPASIAPQPVAKAAPVVSAPRIVAKAAPLSHAPRVVAKATPVAPRVAAKAAPAPRPARVLAKVEPTKALQVVAKPAPRMLVKADPVPKTPRLVAKAKLPGPAPRVAMKPEPVKPPPRIVAKTHPPESVTRALARNEPVGPAGRLTEHALPAVKLARPAAKPEPIAAPQVIAKAAPAVETPRAMARTEAPATASGKLPNTDWLVMLPPEEADADTGAKAAKAAKPKPYAKSQRDLEEYVMKKSSDPYSNLK